MGAHPAFTTGIRLLPVILPSCLHPDSACHFVRYRVLKVRHSPSTRAHTKRSTQIVKASSSDAQPDRDESVPLLSRLLPIAAFAAYVPGILSFQGGAPGTAGTATGALLEALQLSLNFAFVTPLLFPTQAPILHPCYEGMFNAVIAWALLLVGFASEDVSRDQRIPFGLTALAAAFLTNLAYLPFLAIRRANGVRVSRVQRKGASVLLRVAESRVLPVSAFALVLLSTGWALFARPEFGGVVARLATFGEVLGADALAHSLALDALAFCLFQAALVGDDVRRRAWTSTRCEIAVRAARFVPFFGLCFYLWERNQCASLICEDENKL